jgi:two-component system sensor histidine kinase/response regulator
MVRILVIEDDPVIRDAVLDWLQFEGYEAAGAANGRQGVDLALRQPPDLIVSDIVMPEMDGYRVLLELRTHPATALVPFIFLTAKAAREDTRYGMELGADDYIVKPFTREELLGAVTSRLRKADTLHQYATHQMEDLRSTLARSLPHELRTPLVSILGYGELLDMDADSLTPERTREMAQMIVKGGQRLYGLIENYLLYAQIEIEASDPVKLAAYKTASLQEPNTVVASACQQVAHHHQRQADLMLDLNGNGPVHVSEIDLVKITREVVDNAFKFSNPQTPVSVMTRNQKNTWYLRVTDRGRGMKPEDVRRIGAYMQFERAVYEQQGAGLGLVIAKRLVELYEGQMNIESTPGEGTTVSVAFLVTGD